jgi:hypothetical protein
MRRQRLGSLIVSRTDEPVFSRSGLELADTKILDSRLVMLEYRPAT